MRREPAELGSAPDSQYTVAVGEGPHSSVIAQSLDNLSAEAVDLVVHSPSVGFARTIQQSQ